MGENIIFSVIIDTYNYGIYVEQSIKSALRQTFPRENYEIIVVDDGSTDDTRQRVGKYPDVIYHYKENGGQASAFNAGLALSRGRFVAFLDADDYWAPEKLAQIFDRFRSDPAVDVVYHPLTLVDAENRLGEVIPAWFGRLTSDLPIENGAKNMTVFGSATSGIAWRMETLRDLLPVPEEYRLCADGYLMACATLVVRKFALIATPLGFYRIHGGNGYAVMHAGGSTVGVKSQAVAAYYQELFLQHLEQLSEKHSRQGNSVIKEFNLICFTDELLELQSRLGTVKALLALWYGRRRFSGTSGKYRCYRLGVILLRLLVSPSSYLSLQRCYARTSLWLFVKRHIKCQSDSNMGNCSHQRMTQEC